MLGRIFKLQKSRQRIEPRTLNQPIKEIQRLSNLMAAPPLAMVNGPTGPHLRDDSEQPFYAKLTSGSGTGPYAWTRQYWSSSAWHDGFESGTTSDDPAYNGVSFTPTLPAILLLRRQDGVLTFTAGSC
jgi:hypothetical protein